MATRLTIAQGLRRIKKLKGRMGELTARAASVVSWVDGQKPPFDFKTIRAEIATVREELVGLEGAVARANGATSVELAGRAMPLAEAIRRLQELKAEMAWIASLPIREGVERTFDLDWDATNGRQVRVSREVRHVSAMSEPDRVRSLDDLRDQFDRLNDVVEQTNHRTAVDWAAPEAAAQSR